MSKAKWVWMRIHPFYFYKKVTRSWELKFVVSHPPMSPSVCPATYLSPPVGPADGPFRPHPPGARDRRPAELNPAADLRLPDASFGRAAKSLSGSLQLQVLNLMSTVCTGLLACQELTLCTSSISHLSKRPWPPTGLVSSHGQPRRSKERKRNCSD